MSIRPRRPTPTLEKINEALRQDGRRPIVFTTLVDSASNKIVKGSNALVLDMFQTFVEPLEQELELKSSHAMGRGHHNADTEEYKNRIEAINFSLAHDDGQSNRNLADADVILVGVSRSGKTPTSLYLAMQYGVKAANYPLIPEDFERGKLPTPLLEHRSKMFGLSIDPQRLSEIRNERRPGSKYAAPENCRYEINEAEGDDAARGDQVAVVDAQVDRRDRDDDLAGNQARSACVLNLE